MSSWTASWPLVIFDPSKITRGHEAVQELMAEMHASRLKRLTHAGFSDAQAELISNLHTPNFM